MIVLRIRIEGAAQDHAFERSRVTLGAGKRAHLRHEGAGWPALAGTVLQRKAQVVLLVPGRVGEVPLALGRPVTLGRAEITLLVGPPAPPPTFGDYDLAPAATPAAAGAGAPAPAADAARVATAPAPVVSDPFGRRADFDAELFQQLKRTPWFLASLCLHVLLFLSFWLVQGRNDPRVTGGGRVQSALVAETQREATGPEEQEQPPLPEAEPVVPEVPEEVPLFERDPASMENPEIDLVPLEPEEQPPQALGTAPTLAAASRRVAPKPSRPKPAPAIDLQRTFARDSVHDVRREAAEHVRNQLGTGRGGPGDALETLTADDLVVVQGEYDHQERVLRELQIPYRSVASTDPRFENGEALKKARFLFWNCGMPPSDRLLRRLVPQVRAFVERGGYLFTSDWVLGHVLAPAFPDRVGTHGSVLAIPNAVVHIQPVAQHAAHPLLEGVFQRDVAGLWWLESRSHDIVLPRPELVTVLIESPELRTRFRAATPVAVTFAHGRGRVLHVLGHYDQEEGNVAGTVAVQRLALNFVLLSLRERPVR